MFSCFFAAYAVLRAATAGGPSGTELFDRRSVAIETACLLLSSFTCGIASIATNARNQLGPRSACWSPACSAWSSSRMESASSPAWSRRARRRTRSAFLSSFFALVGCHGLHVTRRPAVAATMMAQVFVKGFRADILRRLLCFNLFWHALDIIWVGDFHGRLPDGSGR